MGEFREISGKSSEVSGGGERVVAVGSVRFAIRTGELRSRGGAARLTPRAAAVLKLLVEQAPQLVTKEEFIARVWDGKSVGDEALTSCIQELRRALNDDARQPSYIETRHRRGYRLVAPVGGRAAVSAKTTAGNPSVASLAFENLSGDGDQDYLADAWRSPTTSEVTVTPSATSQSSSTLLPLPDRPSVAVLPFQNMSGDPEQEYFADGISEDIITELTRFHSLFVIARNSSFSYKGKSPDVRDVGRALGVRYVLDGSVRRAGNRVRLTAHLIDSQSGIHIWAERYDRQLDDVFAVQVEVTRSIVRAIAPHVSDFELGRVRRQRADRLSAYEMAVRANAMAWEAFAQSDPKLCTEAIRTAEAALAIDSENTMALVALALAQFQHAVRETAVDPEAAWRHGMAVSERLLELNRTSSNGHVWKGNFLILTPSGPRFDEALASARQGYDLNPHDMASLIGVAWVERLCGHQERAIELLEEALRVSPRDPMRPHLRQQLAYASFGARRYAEGIDNAKRGLTDAPRLPLLHGSLAANYVGLAEYDRARDAMKEACRLAPELMERSRSGKIRSADPEYIQRLTTFMRVAAGLENASAAEKLQ